MNYIPKLSDYSPWIRNKPVFLLPASFVKTEQNPCSSTGHLRVLVSSAQHDSSQLKDLPGFQLYHQLTNEKPGLKILHKRNFTIPSPDLPTAFGWKTDRAKPPAGARWQKSSGFWGSGWGLLLLLRALSELSQNGVSLERPARTESKGRMQEAIPPFWFGQSTLFKTLAKTAWQ